MVKKVEFIAAQVCFEPPSALLDFIPNKGAHGLKVSKEIMWHKVIVLPRPDLWPPLYHRLDLSNEVHNVPEVLVFQK